MNKAFSLSACAAAALILSASIPAKVPSVYPLAGIVAEVDHNGDLVTFCTESGTLYAFTGCGDWEPGDVVACIMDDNGTPDDATDDVILQHS